MMPVMRALAVFLLVTAAACGDDGNAGTPIDAPPDEPDAIEIDAAIAPPLRNAVTIPDDELAVQALQLMGGPVAGAATSSCNDCHSLTRQQLSYWRALSDTTMASCLTDLAVGSKDAALAMVACLRAKPALPTSDFQSKKLGIYAAAAHLPWFQFTFARAYGDAAALELAQFQMNAAMPREEVPPLTQEQFDVVAEWFVRGLPALETTLPNDPPPQTCTPGVSAAVGAHVTAMATTGWATLNRQSSMAMYGCGAATDPRQCLTSTTLVTTLPLGAGWDLAGRGRWRMLRDVMYSTSYWTRSSPDGRFIGHGVQDFPGSKIIDLQRDVEVTVNAEYDPNWFPDNSGFVFQGAGGNVCGQSVLTSNANTVTMQEEACADLQTVGLYEHVGKALDGGDYFAIDGEFVSDDGGHELTRRDPYASFGERSELRFTPMLWSGTRYVARPDVRIDTPFEGDSVLSPSARVMISRIEGPDARQLGFVLRQVTATLEGSQYSIAAPEIARYCISGGKPGFSYDEKWAVYHHYVTGADAVEMGFVGASDPAFAPYLQRGAANVYLLELATGAVTRISNVKPGQYALFPHFRSDGWIYADVRDPAAGREYMVASDAALLLP